MGPDDIVHGQSGLEESLPGVFLFVKGEDFQYCHITIVVPRNFTQAKTNYVYNKKIAKVTLEENILEMPGSSVPAKPKGCQTNPKQAKKSAEVLSLSPVRSTWNEFQDFPTAAC